MLFRSTEELYKKGLNDPNSHDSVITHLEPDILECEVSWALANITTNKGFPCGSVGKESTCNSGDPGSIPGSERSAGEGIGYPLQYSCASLVAQMGKNLPAMRETWV